MDSEEPAERSAARRRRAAERGRRIRELREAAGLTQGRLADLAHLSRQYVSELEAGKRPRPSEETLELLATVLGVSAADLRGPACAAAGDVVPAPSPAEPGPEPAPEFDFEPEAGAPPPDPPRKPGRPAAGGAERGRRTSWTCGGPYHVTRVRMPDGTIIVYMRPVRRSER